MQKKLKKVPKWIWQQINEVACGKTNSYKSTHLAKHSFKGSNRNKGSKKTRSTNGENLDQTHCSCCDKKRQETYNVTFIWDKSSNLNPKPSYKPNLKRFFTLYWLLIILTMVDCNLTIKDHIHGLAANLWSNNEQDINTLGIL